MDPEVHLRNMEEELIQNRLRTDKIEANLQAILNKLDTSQHGMQDGLSFGIAELEKMLESNSGKVEGAPKLTNIRPAIPTDFDGDRRKGHAFFNTCCLYFTIVRDLFPNDQAHIHWALSFFKSKLRSLLCKQGTPTRDKRQGELLPRLGHIQENVLRPVLPKE